MKNNIVIKCIRHISWLMKSLLEYPRFKKNINSETYIFVSHNADNTGGAPVVLLELMRQLQPKYKVFFLTVKPGSLLEQCEKDGVDAYTCYGFKKLYINCLDRKNVKGIVVNTLPLYGIIETINGFETSPNVIWWIHEERKIIQKLADSVPKTLNKNINLLAVSDRVKMDLEEYIPEYKGITGIMYYGCKDLQEEAARKQKITDIYTVLAIGRICERKNQAELIKAIELLPIEVRDRIHVKIVSGSADKDYESSIMELTKENHNRYEYTGAIPRKEMPQLYAEADLLVCSSVDDPLPVVVTEAMMLYTPFITSSRTGQYKLVKDGVDGLVYECGDVNMLSQKILQAFQMNAVQKKNITLAARKLYEENFCPESSINKFLLLMDSEKG